MLPKEIHGFKLFDFVPEEDGNFFTGSLVAVYQKDKSVIFLLRYDRAGTMASAIEKNLYKKSVTFKEDEIGVYKNIIDFMGKSV